MFRRNATRIELKLDDLCEYEAIKKDMEDKVKHNTPEGTDPTATTSSSNGKPKDLSTHDRIGFTKK